jgi:hypothetical protein
MFSGGRKFLFGIAERYRQLKRRLAEKLHRGDYDYGSLSAMSQEIGKMRQLIRADIERRRAERNARKDHRVRTRAKRGPRVERNMRFERRRTSKLTRTVRYSAVAVVALWSLLATLALAVLTVWVTRQRKSLFWTVGYPSPHLSLRLPCQWSRSSSWYARYRPRLGADRSTWGRR